MYMKKFCVLFENKLLHYKDHTDSNDYNNLPGEDIDLRSIIWLRRCIKNEYNDIGLKQLFCIPKVNRPFLPQACFQTHVRYLSTSKTGCSMAEWQRYE